MAVIDENAFKQYEDGKDRMTAQEYSRDRETLRLAINDIEERLASVGIENLRTLANDIGAINENIGSLALELEGKLNSTQVLLDELKSNGTGIDAQARANIGEINDTLSTKADIMAVDNLKLEKANKNRNYKHADAYFSPLGASKISSPLDTEKYVFDLLFRIDSTDNMQGITYANGFYYVGFDKGNNKGVIRKYTVAGTLVEETGLLDLGHCAELAYRKADGLIYVVNGGGTEPTMVYAVNMQTKAIVKTINLTRLGNAGLIGIDNINDRLIVHTASSNTTPPVFTITDFNGDSVRSFSIPNQGIPQGLDCYGDQIYFYTNNKITILRDNGEIISTLPVPKTGESEGLTFAGDFASGNITVGYNGPNRLYALRTVENKLDYHTLQPLHSFNKRWKVSATEGEMESSIPLLPRFAAFTINNTVNQAVWAASDWTNGADYHPLIKSVTQDTTKITVELKETFKSVLYFSSIPNDFLTVDGRTTSVNFDGTKFVVTIRSNTGAIVDPATVKRYGSVSLMAIGGIDVEY